MYGAGGCQLDDGAYVGHFPEGRSQMWWKQMPRSLTTHHWPLPLHCLYHIHTLSLSRSLTLYNIFNVLSFARPVTWTHWHSHKHKYKQTTQPWHMWGNTFCQSYIRDEYSAGSVSGFDFLKLRVWRPKVFIKAYFIYLKLEVTFLSLFLIFI